MSPVHQLDPHKVQEIRTLGKPDDAKARDLLERVAKQVQPLLRRHQLRVPLLSEFFPHNSNLLGLNIGGGGGGTHEIRLRLRRHSREREFFHYEHVLGTMLHEITHNHHGPHDAKFYKLLDQYTAECEELMAKGITGTGQGFDAPPAGKVGGRFHGREVPPHQRRDLALRAAQERAKKQSLMPTGPRKLGGDLTLRVTCDPREAAAIAAERRARDNLWCPAEKLKEEEAAGHNVDSAIQQVLNNTAAAAGRAAGGVAGGSEQQRQQGAGPVPPGRPRQPQQQQQPQQQHPAQPSGQGGQQPQHVFREPAGGPARGPEPDFVDLTADDEEPAGTNAGAGGRVQQPAKRLRAGGGGDRGGSLVPRPQEEDYWGCPVCTLLNKAQHLQCEACATPRPVGFTA